MQRTEGLRAIQVGRVAVAGMALLFLVGCAASQTMISKRNLDVQTKMSETIFLDPVGPEKKVIFVDVRNTSDKDNFDIATPIKDAIAKRGYRITQNPDEAHYRLQANVLSVAKTDPTAARHRYVPSVARARHELGLDVTIGLDEAIVRTARWHRGG